MLLVQLAAGAEHLISGKTVRVNLAGPRPELPLLYMDPSQTQPMLLPQTTGEHPSDMPLCVSGACLECKTCHQVRRWHYTKSRGR